MAIQFNTFFQYEYLSLIIGVASPLPHIHQSLFHLLIFLSFLNMNNEVKMMVGHDFHLTQQDFPLMWKNGVKMMVGQLVGNDFHLTKQASKRQIIAHNKACKWNKACKKIRPASETKSQKKLGLQGKQRLYAKRGL